MIRMHAHIGVAEMGHLGSINMRVMCQLHSNDIQHNERGVFFQKRQTKHQTKDKKNRF